MTAQSILIIGATSAIAEAAARRLVHPTARFALAARRRPLLEHIAADLRLRGAAEVHVMELDVADIDGLPSAVARARKLVGGRIDIAVVAHGTLTEQRRADADHDYAIAEFSVNATATIALLRALAEVMVEQGGGQLVVISSVAGDRGRASNALYGSAKAAVTAFASGLGQRFRRARLLVTVVKPGFVDTPMTAHLRKGPLWASPDAVAKRLVAGLRSGRPVVYAPSFWSAVMAIIKAIPEALFRRLPL